MEDWMESCLEEKVDIENLELLTFDQNKNEEQIFTQQITCKIEEKPLYSSDVNLLAENHKGENIVKEPENDRQYTNSGISSNENEKCQICGLEFGNKAVLNIHDFFFFHVLFRCVLSRKICSLLYKYKQNIYTGPFLSQSHF
mgnify:CR=1 FL=1